MRKLFQPKVSKADYIDMVGQRDEARALVERYQNEVEDALTENAQLERKLRKVRQDYKDYQDKAFKVVGELEAEKEKLKRKIADMEEAEFQRLGDNRPKKHYPTPFYKRLLDEVYVDESVTVQDGRLYDGRNLAGYIGKDGAIYFKSDHVSRKFVQLFPPAKRVENGFHDRALRHGVIAASGFKRAPYYHTKTYPDAPNEYYVKITPEFLQAYKAKVIPGCKKPNA